VLWTARDPYFQIVVAAYLPHSCHFRCARHQNAEFGNAGSNARYSGSWRLSGRARWSPRLHERCCRAADQNQQCTPNCWQSIASDRSRNARCPTKNNRRRSQRRSRDALGPVVSLLGYRMRRRYVTTVLRLDRGSRQSTMAPFAASVAIFVQEPARCR
jgi:hypothetical protein